MYFLHMQNLISVVSIYAVLVRLFSVTFLRKLLSLLSKKQNLLLAQLVKDHKMIVFAPFSSKVTKKAKQEGWETICTQLNVVDILGRQSANIEAVKVEDSDIVFGEEIIVTTTPIAEGKIIIILCK